MKSIKKKRIEQLRKIWGKKVIKYRNFDQIAVYHKLLKENNESIVDEKTWRDLDLDSVFTNMDRNISGIGQQYLYNLLHKNEVNTDLLKQRFNLISLLKNNQKLREEIQLNLLSISGHSSGFIAHLILNKKIPYTRYYRIFYLLSFLSIIATALIFYNGMFIFPSMAVLLINIIINKLFSKRIYDYFIGFSGLNQLIGCAISLSKIYLNQPIKEIEYLKQNTSFLKKLKGNLGFLVIDKDPIPEILQLLIEYANMFLLFDLLTYYRSVNTLLKNQELIHKIYKNVANLDAAISVASFLEEIPYYTNPEFNNLNKISCRRIYHPLIENAVSNTLNDEKNSLLITGSNMSGKTTFIKTMGINFILSQTLYFSFSEEMLIPKLFVKSAIHRNEELEEGKSYFFAEIERINDFIKCSEKQGKYLFIIDEIFRGTNTIERLASSTAVLKYLCKNNKVMVTTHDVELQTLLNENYRMFHFSEQVENDEFFFNYKIKEGSCSSGNAIKLLEIMKYPESVVSEANSISKGLIKNNFTII